jgi:ribonuclease E
LRWLRPYPRHRIQALQILRIIQEESLKDNTASVLCQVPVDVASFLLNEKRSEIAKIELKQRINVLMVPNKTLETPNYKLDAPQARRPAPGQHRSQLQAGRRSGRPDRVTRRAQEPTNKADPGHQGRLPDAPRPWPCEADREPRNEGRTDNVVAADGNPEGRNPEGQAREAREGRNGRGRNGRGPRADGENRNAAGDTRQSQLGFAEGDNHQRDGALEQAITDEGVQAPSPRTENGEPREKRNRDRYGRERGPRGDRSENEERPDLRIPVQPAKVTNDEVAAETTEQASTTAPVTERAPVAALSVVPTKASPVTVTAAPLARMPSVTPFSLPTDALQAVAVSSGLQWVNSDETKVAAVQAAIAAEPKAIHVPRERTELLQIETGPLVLVETRRDLRNMTLPFEQPPSA